jgi:type II secretory ATPase GspE/PulE/Tfp pilus assembly ATPase PilB-like protein
MVKANIKVCVRTRPTVLFVHEKIHVDTDQKTIKIQVSNDHPEESTLPQINNKQSSYKFKFDDTFYNSSQSEVYNNRARNLVQAAIEGTNGAILTYGQTGSGKTFTMVNFQKYKNLLPAN